MAYYEKRQIPWGASHPDLCPDCGARLLLTSLPWGPGYQCENILCKGYASAHATNGEPMGTAVPKEVRQMRVRLHDLIDPLWADSDNPGAKRNEIYGRLAKQLGFEEFHVSSLDKRQCEEVEFFIKAWYYDMGGI